LWVNFILSLSIMLSAMLGAAPMVPGGGWLWILLAHWFYAETRRAPVFQAHLAE